MGFVQVSLHKSDRKYQEFIIRIIILDISQKRWHKSLEMHATCCWENALEIIKKNKIKKKKKIAPETSINAESLFST